ncbi:hypothetical protein SAMN05421820_102746 [Pedobacter steynii]|uniref:Uncharacterized protein n=1 Tax=Pedobacter steynii TaxID=430522 RepID=A0A1G9PTV2_9SPHI|nr:hypothetical protein SAMN05421820_102746 [Pedobacter steynii]
MFIICETIISKLKKAENADDSFIAVKKLMKPSSTYDLQTARMVMIASLP